MFIPDFWCGVGACLLTQIAIIFVAATICAIKNNKGKEEDNNELHRSE